MFSTKPVRSKVVLLSFWGIFGSEQDLRTVIGRMSLGSERKTLYEVFGDVTNVQNKLRAVHVRQLIEQDQCRLQVMIDPHVEMAISLGEIVLYLTMIGLGPEVVWTNTANDLLSQRYDAVADFGQNTCYHTVITVGSVDNLREKVCGHFEDEELRALKRRLLTNKSHVPHDQVDLHAPF